MPYFYGADFNLSCFPKFWAQMFKFGLIGPKTSNFPILTKFPHVLYFEGADFIFDIRLPKFWAKMPKLGYFEPKSINFLILIFPNISQINLMFLIYPISKILISNLKFVFKNFEMRVFWVKKYQLSDLNEILPAPLFWRCWFQIWHLLSKIFSPNL